ncbi:Hexokinase family protein XprF [Rasamsonia emersonii CBS 393.64]|uniref:Phosphotransferase n=1 Tax=Rasamsonia emersonii (strain ATCC 16479 / CBS 393.64 / IMI 116815) TaxID=1408163 RepID=A0A0F4YT49_RASE3|nr:Hexokinase family protein XprF [Rasamsonia emersonii CBS 393.64]KKA21021.1 Hexokinase family protein XprF [Rasamsonia emersonii CBS 393.64]
MAAQPLVVDTKVVDTNSHDVDQNHINDEVDEEEEDIASDLDQPNNEPNEPGPQIDPLDDFLKPLVLDEGILYNLARRFSEVYRHLALTSDQQFLPTPVTRLPTGEEVGRYLAIDVGGSNLRVAFIELLGEDADSDKGTADASDKSRDTIRKAQRPRVRRTLEKAWPIQEHLKKDKADDLFSWIGDCIAEVVADSLTSDATKGDIPDELEMGITFSFPIMQESVTEATLMPMGKGFAITSDLNLRNMLLSGYEKHTRRPDEEEEPSSKRRKLFALPKLKITAITNDTVATLISLAYSVKSLPNSRVAMGIIVGTGCNATIPMRLSDLHESKARLVNSKDPEATQTVVNTEWTISGAAPPLKELNITTKWDTQLDNACARPGFQPFEYMTGGRYIGELVRIVLFDYLTTVVGLSKKDLPAALVQEYALNTTFLSEKVARSRSDQELATELARSLPPPESSDWNWDAHSAGAFRKIARAVQTRSAGLIAAAVVGLLACTREIQLKDDSTRNSPQPAQENPVAYQGDVKTQTGSNNLAPNNGGADSAKAPRGPIVPVLSPAPADWHSGPEELVVAYTGGIIQNYPNFKEMCQTYIDRLIMRTGPQKGGKSVFLREASDGGVIGAGVLAGMVAGR